MFDPRRPIAKALMTPGQPTQICVIPSVVSQLSGRDESVDDGANTAPVLSRNNNQAMPHYSEMKNIRKEGVLSNGHIDFEGPSFSLEQKNNTRTSPQNSKDGLIDVIASISPETIEALMKLFVLSLVSHANGSQTAGVQALPNDSHFKDILQLVLTAKGIPFQSEGDENSKEFHRNVRIIFDEIIKFEIFPKVYLTKKYQKKYKAKEIDKFLEFLIAEGGVLEKVEQEKRASNGRAPSPRYRLIRQNPKYFPMNKY